MPENASVPERFGWHPEPELLDPTLPGAREALTALGADTWAAALDFLYGEALERPVGPASYEELRELFFGATGRPAPAPADASPWAAVLDEIRARVLPFGYNAQHPRSFSYFTTPPLPSAVATEALTAWLHQCVDVFHASPIGTLVEEEVTAWLRDLVGFDSGGWGVLTSGGVMANIMAMTVVRDVWLPRLRALDDRPRGAALEGVRVYASDQAHFSIARALDTLGMPADTLRVLPSDERFRLRSDVVADAVAADRAAGLLPLAIAAVAGTTNTGSVDDIAGLADVAERERLWLHVDAAYGGAARLSARDASRVPALDRADSVTVDPHKWFYQPFDIGALVVRRRTDLHRTFTRSPEYYRSSVPGRQATTWMEYTMEGSRPFRGLRLWASWKHLGTNGFGRLIEANDDIARALDERLRSADDFEVAVPDPDLAVVCFRHVGDGALDDEALDAHQDGVQRSLEVSGKAWVSTTKLRGRTFLRAGVVNHLTTEADLDALIEAIRAV